MTDRSHDRHSTAPTRGSRRLTSPRWLARAAGAGLSLTALGFVLSFLLVVGGGTRTLLTRPLPVQIVLGLPYVVVALTAGTTLGAALAWRYRYWSLTGRLHQTALALLGLVFCWALAVLGFLGL
ncbi:hypothetical protein [Haloglomus litoreum]|uniref:hypothetical protein n=1 Tax=Haloglomus litoreum TaxID=3034026 RepID=UPI0023E882C6|nr:hypothetical protein [Haloglomus sp. DT116]